MFSIFPINGGVCATEGFTADGVHSGLKPNNGLDLAFIKSDNLCECAAVFTSNKFQAAPILHAKEKIAKGVDGI